MLLKRALKGSRKDKGRIIGGIESNKNVAVNIKTAYKVTMMPILYLTIRPEIFVFSFFCQLPNSNIERRIMPILKSRRNRKMRAINTRDVDNPNIS